MSHPIPSSADDDLDELALRYALGALSEEERTQFETCMACPHSKAAILAAEYRDSVAGMMTASLPMCPPPRPEVKTRIFEAIRQSERPPVPAAPPLHAPGSTFIGRDESSWMPTPFRGVRLRELSSTSPDLAIVLLALDPGAKYPSHDHQGAEDIYILHGEATMAGRRLRAGDFLHWESGTRHHEMTSAEGCEAMVITSRQNYSAPLVHGYSLAHRLVAGIGRALGAKTGE